MWAPLPALSPMVGHGGSNGIPVPGPGVAGGAPEAAVALTVKNLPVMQETRVRFLSQEDPLEKGMAIHSSILAWRIPWTEKPGGLQFMGWQTVGHD